MLPLGDTELEIEIAVMFLMSFNQKHTRKEIRR